MIGPYSTASELLAYLEDRTTLRFTQLREREWRSFEPPPGW